MNGQDLLVHGGKLWTIGELSPALGTDGTVIPSVGPRREDCFPGQSIANDLSLGRLRLERAYSS